MQAANAEDPDDVWTIDEVRIMLDGKELPRTPQWRVLAHPFPWDAELAFDKNPVTRWCSWQHLASGMFIEADFGRPEMLDSVVLQCSPQWKIQLKLEGQLMSGEWKTLAGAPERSFGPPLRDLRRLATQTLKRNGIDFLLVTKGDALADDLAQRSREWNLTLVAQVAADSLYRLD